jgi:hypothetical protein
MSRNCANGRRNNIQWIPITKFVLLPCMDTDCVVSRVGFGAGAAGPGDANHGGRSAYSCCAYIPGTEFASRDDHCEDPREASARNPAITGDTCLVMASSIHRSAVPLAGHAALGLSSTETLQLFGLARGEGLSPVRERCLVPRRASAPGELALFNTNQRMAQ